MVSVFSCACKLAKPKLNSEAAKEELSFRERVTY